MVNASTKFERDKTEYYPTPPDVTASLLRRLNIPNGTQIWECACGEGFMAEAMIGKGYKVYATNLHDQGYGEVGKDFLTTGDQNLDWIITNPPFKLADKFIEHAASFEKKKHFAFLLKNQYWHARKRTDLFRNNPPSLILALNWRPDFLFGARGGTPTMEVCWNVWFADDISGRTIYEVLERALN